MAKYPDFEEMEVWRLAQELAVATYEGFAKCRDFSFVDQIKRASVSVSNNIAEGSERSSFSDFARYLDIAKGSTGEVRSMYYLAERFGFVTPQMARDQRDQCREIAKQLGGFAKHLRNK